MVFLSGPVEFRVSDGVPWNPTLHNQNEIGQVKVFPGTTKLESEGDRYIVFDHVDPNQGDYRVDIGSFCDPSRVDAPKIFVSFFEDAYNEIIQVDPELNLGSCEVIFDLGSGADDVEVSSPSHRVSFAEAPTADNPNHQLFYLKQVSDSSSSGGADSRAGDNLTAQAGSQSLAQGGLGGQGGEGGFGGSVGDITVSPSITIEAPQSKALPVFNYVNSTSNAKDYLPGLINSLPESVQRDQSILALKRDLSSIADNKQIYDSQKKDLIKFINDSGLHLQGASAPENPQQAISDFISRIKEMDF